MKEESEREETLVEVDTMAEVEKKGYDVTINGCVETIAAATTTINKNGEGVVDQYEDWWRWCRPRMLVDEEMSWGSIWYSFWDKDDDSNNNNINNNNNVDEFYGDVLEDDIWNLRSIQQIPQ
ncbi:hypothetical protein vseg_007411 [Gypsophila vaccaria]